MPSGKPGHGSKRPTDAQPQNEILRSWGLGGFPQQAAPEAEWLSRGIACHLCWGNLSSMAAFLFDIYVYLWYIEINIRGEVKR